MVRALTNSGDRPNPDKLIGDFVRGLTNPGKGRITRAPSFDRLRRRPGRYCVQSRAPFPSSLQGSGRSGRKRQFRVDPQTTSIYIALGMSLSTGSIMDARPIVIVGLICLLTRQVLAEQPSADEIAQKQAEQAAPRTRVAFDPKQFDEYVGYYQLTPKAIVTVTRDGEHFFAQLSGQPAFEVFPESPNKFSRRPRGHPMPRTWPVLPNITPRFLTAGGSDYWPCFSPNGKTVLFSRTTNGHDWELLRVPVSGGEAEKLAKSLLPVAATRGSWSSKTNLIAFTGMSADGSSATWVIKSDGTGAHALTAAGLSDQMFYPSWYPDGSRLVAMDGRNLGQPRRPLRNIRHRPRRHWPDSSHRLHFERHSPGVVPSRPPDGICCNESRLRRLRNRARRPSCQTVVGAALAPSPRRESNGISS
jgi:hypothetical protein